MSISLKKFKDCKSNINSIMTTQSIVKVHNPVIVLAAGLSERMGHPKAFMMWNNHITFLEKLVNEYTSFCSTQIVYYFYG